MGEAKRRKLSRDASPEEILGGHGPVQDKAAHLMRAMLKACQQAFPGYAITVFVSEPEAVADAEGRDPRFNYASTADRRDMIAVLKAFIARNEEMEKIDAAAAAEPPTGSRQ